MATCDGPAQSGLTRNVVLAFLGGAVAGAVTALLLAPKSGRESRKQLGGYADKAGQAYKTFIGQSRKFLDEQSRKLHKAVKMDQEGVRTELETKKAS